MAYGTFTPPSEEFLSQLNATTDKYYAKTAGQLVYENSALLKRFMSQRKIKVRGGTNIQWNARIQKLGTGGKVDPRESVSWSTNDTRVGVQIGWSYYFAKTLMQWDEITMNDGEAQILDLSADKATELSEEMTDVLITALWRTASKQNDDMYSLNDVIGTGEYAGLDPAVDISDATRWQSIVEDTASMTLYLYNDSTNTSLASAITQARWSDRGPTVMVTTDDIFNGIESYLITNFGQVKINDQMAKIGIPNIEFKGIPIITDQHCPDGYLLGIDEKAIELVVHPRYDRKTTKWKEHENYPNALFKGMSWVGNLKSTTRHTHFKYTGLAGVQTS